MNIFNIEFLYSFLISAGIYAFLASFTTLFYRKKSVFSLSVAQNEVLNGTASIGTRLKLFFINVLLSYRHFPVYILAIIINIIWRIVIK